MMLGLIFVNYLATQWDWADVLLKQSQYKMSQWTEKTTVPEWQIVKNQLETALSLNRSNPEIWQNLGILDLSVNNF